MQVTHFGHSCVLLDTGAARLLIDPGTFSTGFEDVTGLDAVLVTHQHPDHLDPDRLPALLRANPDARLIVDSGTAGQLGGVDHEAVEPGATVTVAGARVEVLGGQHAVIHPDIPRIATTPTSSTARTCTPATRSTTVARRRGRAVPAGGAPWSKLSRRSTTCARWPRARRCRSTRGSSPTRPCLRALRPARARSRRRCGRWTRASRSPCNRDYEAQGRPVIRS